MWLCPSIDVWKQLVNAQVLAHSHFQGYSSPLHLEERLEVGTKCLNQVPPPFPVCSLPAYSDAELPKGLLTAMIRDHIHLFDSVWRIPYRCSLSSHFELCSLSLPSIGCYPILSTALLAVIGHLLMALDLIIFTLNPLVIPVLTENFELWASWYANAVPSHKNS